MTDRNFLRWYPACIAAVTAAALLTAWGTGELEAEPLAGTSVAGAEPLEAAAGDGADDDPAVRALQAEAAQRRARRRKARNEWRAVLAASARVCVVPAWSAGATARFAGTGRPRAPRPPCSPPLDTRGVCVLPGPERAVCGWLAANLAVGPAVRGVRPVVPEPTGGPFGPEVRWLEAQLREPGLTDDRVETLQLRLADARARQRRFPHSPR